MITANGIIDSNQKIVTNGLIVNYDAAQLRSYSGSGSTWNDISGNNNNGTLINNPTFSTGFGGNFLFNGTNQSVSIPITTPTTNQGSLCFWIRYLNGNVTICCFSDTVLGPINSYTSTLYINASAQLVGYTYDPSVAPAQKYVTDSNAMIVGGYYYCALTWQNGIGNTGNLSVSLNGLTKSSVAITSNTIQNIFYIATKTGLSGVNAFNSNIYCAQLYNRSLTTSELTQNYKAIKSRFGL
jgi:hypothetical protein